MISVRVRRARPRAAAPALASLLLFSGFASAADVDWSNASSSLEGVKGPLIAMLVIAITIFLAFAWYRVATGQSVDKDDD